MKFLRKRSALLARTRRRGGVLVLDAEVVLFSERLRTSTLFAMGKYKLCAETSFQEIQEKITHLWSCGHVQIVVDVLV